MYCFGDNCFSFVFLFLLAIVFCSVLQFTDSDDRFGIFKLFLIYVHRVSLPYHIRFLLVLSGVRIARFLVFCAVFCRSMNVPLSLFVLPLCCLYLFTNSDYSLGISKFYFNLKIISTNEQVKCILK